jgi:glutamate synthase (NADPH/NADH) small chain
MGKITGFMEATRELPKKRRVEERIRDYKELYLPVPEEKKREQAGRCMNCGIPFCHTGCPLGNLIPDWNDLVYTGNWKAALDELHATNNFPEFTGRLCPAPCEEACVLGINEPAVTIEEIEKSIIERGFAEGWVKPVPPASRTGKKVAVIGSGPSGLACAQQLNRAGHSVTVLERADRIGGLLRYGIPHFKMEKWVIDRRLDIMAAEGVEFKTSVEVGKDVSKADLEKDYDAVVFCGGATISRAHQTLSR